MALWMRWLVSRIQVSMLPRSNARVQMPPSPTKEKQCSEVWISVGLTLDHQEHGMGTFAAFMAKFGKDVLHINDKSSVLRDPSRQLNVDGFGKPTVGSLLISLHTTAFSPFARGIRRSGWLDGVYR